MLLLLETEASEVDRTNCGEKGGSCKKPRDEARTSTGRGISWDVMRAMAFSLGRAPGEQDAAGACTQDAKGI